MRLLESLHLVQFFLFGKQSFDFRRTTGIFGPNGTGKTALLDALQIGILGANERESSFNARAEGSDRRGRSIKQYCLGQTGDEETSRLRSSALTYITIVVRDQESGEPLSAGVCVSASATTPSYRVHGHYIVPGVALALDDHIEHADSGDLPLEWNIFRERINRFPGCKILLNSDDYLRELTFALRTSRGRAPDIGSIRKAFRNAMQLRQIDSVDEAVRRYVIDEGGVDLSRLRACAESFNSLRQTIAKLEIQLADARRAREHYDRAAEHCARAANWMATRRSCELDACVADQDTALLGQTQAAEAEEEASRLLQRHQASKSLLSAQIGSLRDRQLNHAAHREQGLGVQRMEKARVDAETRSREISLSLRLMAEALESATQAGLADLAPDEFVRAASAVRAARDSLDHVELEALVECVAAGARLSAKAAESVQNQVVQLGMARTRAEARKKDLLDNLERLSSGRPELRANTQAVQRALADRGINTTPVCDLVSMTDRTWQPAIEAFLGAGNLEALLVHERDEREAARVYEALPDRPEYQRVKLALSEIAINRARSPALGSAARLIEGKNLAAVSFVRNMLGDLLCASDLESARGKFAITQSAMLFSGGAVERFPKPSPAQLKLGKVDQSERRREIELEIQDLDSEIRRLGYEASKIDGLWKRLRGCADPEVATDVRARWLAWKQFSGEYESLRESSSRGMDADYRALCDQIVEIDKALSHVDSALGDAKAANAVAHNEALRWTEMFERSREAIIPREAALREAKAHPDFSADIFERYRDDVHSKYPEPAFGDQATYCEAQRESNERAHGASLVRARTALNEYCTIYQSALESGLDEDWRKAREWIGGRIAWIVNSELVNYKAQVEDAYEHAVQAFRGDVAAAIADQLGKLHRQQRLLNETLDRSPSFSNNERYRFRRTLVEEHRALHDFVIAVGGTGGGDLLGSADSVPEAFRAILEGSSDPKIDATSPLSDYRRFFAFEVDILNGARVVAKLSSRLRSGSGGEHKTPLYVIAGAALASAYGKREGALDGFGVMLLDEAYEKMDPRNSIAVSKYLYDLGLQPVFAAPGDSQGTLSAVMDNYYNMMRFDNTILVEHCEIEPDGRTLMVSDSWEEHPDLIDQEIARLAGETTLPAQAHAPDRT